MSPESIGKKHTYLYYQVFQDGTPIDITNIAHPHDPTVGRINIRYISPPRTVELIKRAIAKTESINLTRIAAIFAGTSEETPLTDSSRLSSIWADNDAGMSAEEPFVIALELGNIGSKRSLGPQMSLIEPGKVTSSMQPVGWSVVAVGPKGAWLCIGAHNGRLHWAKEMIEPHTLLFVDETSLRNHADGNKIWPMFPAVVQHTRDWGFVPVESIVFGKVPENANAPSSRS